MKSGSCAVCSIARKVSFAEFVVDPASLQLSRHDGPSRTGSGSRIVDDDEKLSFGVRHLKILTTG